MFKKVPQNGKSLCLSVSISLFINIATRNKLQAQVESLSEQGYFKKDKNVTYRDSDCCYNYILIV